MIVEECLWKRQAILNELLGLNHVECISIRDFFGRFELEKRDVCQVDMERFNSLCQVVSHGFQKGWIKSDPTTQTHMQRLLLFSHHALTHFDAHQVLKHVKPLDDVETWEERDIIHVLKHLMSADDQLSDWRIQLAYKKTKTQDIPSLCQYIQDEWVPDNYVKNSMLLSLVQTSLYRLPTHPQLFRNMSKFLRRAYNNINDRLAVSLDRSAIKDELIRLCCSIDVLLEPYNQQTLITDFMSRK